MADKKFSPMRYTAATEESAINGALQIVGATRDEIEYDVLEQSAKGVTVRIKPRLALAPVAETLEIAEEPEEPSPIVEDVPELLSQSEELEAAENNDSDSNSDNEPETEIEAQIGDELSSLAADFADETPDFDLEVEGESAEIENFDSQNESAGDEFEENESAENEAPETGTSDAEQPAVTFTALDPQIVAQVQSKAQEFLDKMGLDAQALLDQPKESHSAALVIEGDDVGILIGKHGATLQAFQYLLNLTINAHLDGEEARRDAIRVVVDAGNYRARRQSSLEQTARGAASKARRDGRMVRLDPMPAHERRLVHMFLQTESDIVTQSEGREPMRRIVVSPAIAGATAGTPASAPRAERSGETREPSRDSSRDASRSGNRGGMGSFRRGDAQSERNRGLQRGR